MADQLEIIDVKLGTARPSLFDASQQRLDVAIHLQNNSSKTLHVLASVRTLDYDPATKTLLVGLIEPEPQAGVKPLHFVAPATTTVGPHQSTTIQVSVPLVIKKVVPSNTLGLGVENLDISGVQNVKVRVASDATPFYPKPTDPAEKIIRALNLWGAKTEKTLPRSPGSSGPEPVTPPKSPPRKRK